MEAGSLCRVPNACLHTIVRLCPPADAPALLLTCKKLGTLTAQCAKSITINVGADGSCSTNALQLFKAPEWTAPGLTLRLVGPQGEDLSAAGCVEPSVEGVLGQVARDLPEGHPRVSSMELQGLSIGTGKVPGLTSALPNVTGLRLERCVVEQLTDAAPSASISPCRFSLGLTSLTSLSLALLYSEDFQFMSELREELHSLPCLKHFEYRAPRSAGPPLPAAALSGLLPAHTQHFTLSLGYNGLSHWTPQHTQALATNTHLTSLEVLDYHDKDGALPLDVLPSLPSLQHLTIQDEFLRPDTPHQPVLLSATQLTSLRVVFSTTMHSCKDPSFWQALPLSSLTRLELDDDCFNLHALKLLLQHWSLPQHTHPVCITGCITLKAPASFRQLHHDLALRQELRTMHNASAGFSLQSSLSLFFMYETESMWDVLNKDYFIPHMHVLLQHVAGQLPRQINLLGAALTLDFLQALTALSPKLPSCYELCLRECLYLGAACASLRDLLLAGQLSGLTKITIGMSKIVSVEDLVALCTGWDAANPQDRVLQVVVDLLGQKRPEDYLTALQQLQSVDCGVRQVVRRLKEGGDVREVDELCIRLGRQPV